MPDVVVDTHILIWMLTDPGRLSPKALASLRQAEADSKIFIPSISLVEIIYLTERERIPEYILSTINNELLNGDTSYRVADLTKEIANEIANVPRNEIPEMPDRIISATALSLGIPLITADLKIIRCDAVDTI